MMVMTERDVHPEQTHDDEFERGLAHDLQRMMDRRRMIFTVGGAGIGALVLAACGSDAGSSSETTAPSTAEPAPGNTVANTVADTSPAAIVPPSAETSAETNATTATECVPEIPDETGGPYPGDGTNGVNVLTEDGIVRSDITSSFGSSTTTTDGIPMELVLTIQDAASCAPVEGAAVYLWHCTAAGEYSLYSDTVLDENFLRGVQESDTNGQVRFATVVPGCYDGRWPHMHFEIFSALSDAISGNNSIKTTQLAIPAAISETVYSDARYPRSADNLARVSLASDMVFADDGGAQQMASMSGDNAAGYRGQLTVGI
jgi:protocatechuate 3,4-dioxygenase beta subunit